MKSIKYYALWCPVVGGIAAYLLHRHFGTSDAKMIGTIATGVLIGLVAQLYIWSMNQMKVKNGKPLDKLGWLDAFDLYDQYAVDTGKWAAMHPAVDERLLQDEPVGYVLGRYRDKYVCVTFDLPGAANVYINGGSGTQKTSAAGIITSALRSNDPENESNVRQLILDPKGEIHDITSYPGDGTYHISPSDRTTYGYDPFFPLDEESTEQEVFETAQVIAIAIIPKEKGETDPIWRNSSRAMLIAFIIFGWMKKGFRNLAQVFSWSMSATVQELVAEVVENSSPSSTAFKLVIAYYGDKAPDDMVGSIYGTLVSRIEIFVADKDLEYAIGWNPRKYNPSMLLDGSCFLNIPSDKLTQYAGLSALILNQQMLYIMGLPDIVNDPDRPRIQVIVDEASALLEANRLDYLCNFLRLERSKGCMSVLVAQSYSGLLCSYSKPEAEDILSNCPYKLFLDATTTESQELLAKLVGKFQMRTASYSGYGSQRKRTISYHEADIVTTSDMETLGSSKEMILLSSIGGFSMIRKCPWYKDKVIKKIAKKIKRLMKKGGNKNG